MSVESSMPSWEGGIYDCRLKDLSERFTNLSFDGVNEALDRLRERLDIKQEPEVSDEAVVDLTNLVNLCGQLLSLTSRESHLAIGIREKIEGTLKKCREV